MKLSALQVLLFGIPENVAYALFCCTLLCKGIVWKEVLTIALTQAGIYFFIRLLPLPFGIHTLVGIVSLFFLMKYFSKDYITKIFLVVLSIFFIAGIGEFINLTILGVFFGKEVVFEDQKYALFFGFFQLIYLYAVVYLTMRFKTRKSTFSVPK